MIKQQLSLTLTRYCSEFERGGHFTALDATDLLICSVQHQLPRPSALWSCLVAAHGVRTAVRSYHVVRYHPTCQVMLDGLGRRHSANLSRSAEDLGHRQKCSQHCAGA